MFYYREGDLEKFSRDMDNRYKEKPDSFEYQNYRAVRLMLSLRNPGVGQGGDLPGAFNSLKNHSEYDIKKDGSGSFQVSPSHRILSLSGGKLIDIMEVQ
jgi:hypothetical protein